MRERKSRKTSRPLILCEICKSFAVETGMVKIMNDHRKNCHGKPGAALRALRIRRREEN